jgi:hypothetical protein
VTFSDQWRRFFSASWRPTGVLKVDCLAARV